MHAFEPDPDYLKPSPSVDCHHPLVCGLALELTQQTSDVHEKARKLFVYVRDQIKYDIHSPFFLPEHYLASAIFLRRSGYCVQKAVALAALARASDIPARLIYADIVNHLMPEHACAMLKSNLFVYHCYVELFLDRSWVKMVPSFDKELCHRYGFPLVEFDGFNHALFEPFDQNGRRFIEYRKTHGAFIDVPLREILSAWERSYGHETVEKLKQLIDTKHIPNRPKMPI